MREGDDTVWRLTEDNRDSYERALARAVRRDLRLSASNVIPINDLDDVTSALGGGNYRNVVYVGHSVGDGNTGYLMPGEAIGGDEFARALPASVRRVDLIGCVSDSVAAQGRMNSTGITFNGSRMLVNQYIDFDASTLSQQVTNISFRQRDFFH
jgi:pimeloyl-ACP methyl ester carboxylesterase